MSIQAVAWAHKHQGMRTPQRMRAYLKTDGHCYYCGLVLKTDAELYGLSSGHTNRMCIDHVVATSIGGGNEDENLVAACRICNSAKREMPLDKYRARLAMRAVGRPEFTDEQIEWLEANGFVFPELEEYAFFGERE